jgi:hypothetical protein
VPGDELEKVELALPLASSDALPLGNMVLMRALQFVGPRAFGYDVDYKPLVGEWPGRVNQTL